MFKRRKSNRENTVGLQKMISEARGEIIDSLNKTDTDGELIDIDPLDMESGMNFLEDTQELLDKLYEGEYNVKKGTQLYDVIFSKYNREKTALLWM